MSTFFSIFDRTGGEGCEGSIEANGRRRDISGGAVYYFEPLIGLTLGQIVKAEMLLILPYLAVLAHHELIPPRLLRSPPLLLLTLTPDHLQVHLLGLIQDLLNLLIMLSSNASLAGVVGWVLE